MFYLARFSCNYMGCDETIGFKSDTREAVENFCDDYLPDYAQSWEHMIDFYGDEEEEGSEEYEDAVNDFYENCDYYVSEYEDFEDIDGRYDTFEDLTK